jgi:hypothetical protein
LVSKYRSFFCSEANIFYRADCATARFVFICVSQIKLEVNRPMIYRAFFYAGSSWLLRYCSEVSVRKFPCFVLYDLRLDMGSSWTPATGLTPGRKVACFTKRCIFWIHFKMILIWNIFRIIRPIFVPFKSMISFSWCVLFTFNRKS